MKRRNIQIVMRNTRIRNNNIRRTLYNSNEMMPEKVVQKMNEAKRYILDEDEIYRFECMIHHLIENNAKVSLSENEYNLYTSHNNGEASIYLYFYERHDGCNMRFYGYDGKKQKESNFSGYIEDISSYKKILEEYAETFHVKEKERNFNNMEDILDIQLSTILRKSNL